MPISSVIRTVSTVRCYLGACIPLTLKGKEMEDVVAAASAKCDITMIGFKFFWIVIYRNVPSFSENPTFFEG